MNKLLKRMYKRKFTFFSVLFFSVFIFSSFLVLTNQRAPYRVRAEQEEINVAKDELKTKTLSELCQLKAATSISPFQECQTGKQRLSANMNNPYFFCCR